MVRPDTLSPTRCLDFVRVSFPLYVIGRRAVDVVAHEVLLEIRHFSEHHITPYPCTLEFLDGLDGLDGLGGGGGGGGGEDGRGRWGRGT